MVLPRHCAGEHPPRPSGSPLAGRIALTGPFGPFSRPLTGVSLSPADRWAPGSGLAAWRALPGVLSALVRASAYAFMGRTVFAPGKATPGRHGRRPCSTVSPSPGFPGRLGPPVISAGTGGEIDRRRARRQPKVLTIVAERCLSESPDRVGCLVGCIGSALQVRPPEGGQCTGPPSGRSRRGGFAPRGTQYDSPLALGGSSLRGRPHAGRVLSAPV